MDKLYIIFMVCAIIFMIVVGVLFWTHYGNTPVSELPAWALLFFR